MRVKPAPPCTISDCGDPQVARGWCRKHYTRWNRYGDTSFVADQSRQPCSIVGCAALNKAKELCETHYRRAQRNGAPLTLQRVRLAGGPEDRFWPRVHINAVTGCWLWLGRITQHGYGQFGRAAHAYRWSYEHFVGPVPKGLELDHLCRNRACVNPEHLEPVTHAENNRRGISVSAMNARKTHCLRGHEYTPANTYVYARTSARECVACRKGRKLRASLTIDEGVA